MTSIRSCVVGTVVSFAVAGCGGFGSTIAIELTDAPPSISSIDRIEISVAKVEVHTNGGCPGDEPGTTEDHDDDRPGNAEWITVTERAGTFDLLSLRNDVTAPLGDVDVRGRVDRIRLQFEVQGTNQVVLKDGQTCALDMSSVDPAGMDISHEFEAIAPPRGGRATVVVDLDASESIEQTGACSFALKPVLKIKRVETQERAE